jgi:hypothetical protein
MTPPGFFRLVRICQIVGGIIQQGGGYSQEQEKDKRGYG